MNIAESRASARAAERLLNAGEAIREAWDSLRLGWSYDDLIEWVLGSAQGFPEDQQGRLAGLVTSAIMVGVERDREGREDEHPAPKDSETFEVETTEAIVLGPYEGKRCWGSLRGRRYCVIMAHEVVDTGDVKRWHISISDEAHRQEGSHDVPVWRDFVTIVHQLRPGVPFVLGIPPRNMWMNKNPNVLHAWETRDRALIEHWRMQADVVAGTDAAEPS